MSAPDQTTHVQQLFVQHIAVVKYFVLSLLPNPSEAEDIVQEVFLTVTAKANDFEPGTNFKAWVLTIARFKALEQLRREHRSQKRLSDEVIERLAEETDPIDPHRDAARKRALRDCIAKLAAKPRTMIELQYRENLKPAAIARQLGWDTNAVYVALSRARADLRHCVKHQESTP
ncbi:MAG: sigma-70 family RNA polymerase sigma factor [Verrucomicrobiota bacterium]